MFDIEKSVKLNICDVYEMYLFQFWNTLFQ